MVTVKNAQGAFKAPPIFLACFVVFVLMILALNSGPTIMDDTDSYHIQLVKWASEYGTVPGIANLHLRYGFNSSWFLAIALLTPNTAGIDHYMTLNGLISVWLTYYLLRNIFNPGGKNGTQRSNSAIAALVVLVLGLVAWPMIRGNATTANYDFISTCLIIVLFMEAGKTRRPAAMPEWIVWPFFLCTIKLVYIACPILCLLSLTRNFTRRSFLICLAAAFFILFPFFVRNVIISGYLFYPLQQPDLVTFDWKVPGTLVAELMKFTEDFNRSSGNPELVSHLRFPVWVPIWHAHLANYDKLVTDLSLLCWFLIALRWKQLTKAFSEQYLLLVFMLLIVLLVWFFVAPDPRFIYGVLLASIYILILMLPPIPEGPHSSRWLTAGILFLSLSLSIYTVHKIVVDDRYSNWIVPRPLPVPAVTQVAVDGIQMRIPEKLPDNWNARCYDLPLPCLYTISPMLHARGRKIKDGFKMVVDTATGPVTGEFKRYN
jgi:hypothetical protein